MNSIIPNINTKKQFNSVVNRLFKKNKIESLLKQSNLCKEKGTASFSKLSTSKLISP